MKRKIMKGKINSPKINLICVRNEQEARLAKIKKLAGTKKARHSSDYIHHSTHHISHNGDIIHTQPDRR